MKMKNVMMTVLFTMLSIVASFAQQKGRIVSIDPERLTITYNKTTNLIFPYSIKSVDVGSKEVLVQKAIGVENVLQLKAAKQGFNETNLTVITSEGSFHSFILNYALLPANLNVQVSKVQLNKEDLAVFTEAGTSDKVRELAEQVSLLRRGIKKISDQSHQVGMDVKGIYIKDEVCYVQLLLQNTSPINYDLRSFRLFIQDKKKAKRTAKQEVDIEPIYTFGNIKSVNAHSEQIVVIALPKFTIPDNKWFCVSMQEEKGGRHLSIRFGNRTLLKAGTL